MQASVDGRNASVQTDPSLGTVSTSTSTSVQVPELELPDVRLGIVQKLSEVAQQVGLSLDVNTLCSFVSSGGVSLQCFGHCTIRAVRGNSIILCCPFSSMVTCMLTTFD